MIGEFKGGRDSSSFLNEEKGQLLSYLQDFLLIHKFRSLVYGFLADGTLIQFFCLIKRNNDWSFQEFPVMFLKGEGIENLVGLMCSELKILGVPSPIKYQEQELKVDEMLGVGASSIVFKSSCNNQEVVIKRFHPNRVEKLLVEKKILNILSEKEINGVTKYLGTSDDGSALILSPVGKPFMRVRDLNYGILPTAQHYCSLLKILQSVHKIGIVHRDIKPENFFLDKEVCFYKIF